MKKVTKDERENWIINIEKTASTVSSQLRATVVDGVFQRYGAHIVSTEHFTAEFKSGITIETEA